MSQFVAIPLTSVEQQIIAHLKVNGSATAKDMGVSLGQIKNLTMDGVKQFVVVKGTRKHINADGKPSRGRPESVFALNKRGQDKARRMKKVLVAA